jgi:hypothetical protein
MHNMVMILNVNLSKISLACKYEITSVFSCMSKAPSPFNSMFVSQESLLPMLIWGTSQEHPSMVHKYAKVYHVGTTSKFASLRQ